MTQPISRDTEMDLGPLVNLLDVRIEDAIFRTARESGRDAMDVCIASLLSLARSAGAIRSAFSIPVEVWAEANRLAQDPASLLNLTPQTPAARELQTRLHVQARLIKQ